MEATAEKPSNQLALFDRGEQLVPFNGKELAFLKDHTKFDFEWENNPRPVYLTGGVFHLGALERYGGGDGDVEEGVRVTVGPILGSHVDGAVRVSLPKYSVGVLTDCKSKGGALMHSVLFVQRSSRKTVRIYVGWCRPDIMKGKFTEDAAKVTKAFSYSLHVPDGVYEQKGYDCDGKPRWRGLTVSKGWRDSTKRVPLLLLLQENWQFNPKFYPTNIWRAFSKFSTIAIEAHESTRGSTIGRRKQLLIKSEGRLLSLSSKQMFALRRHEQLARGVIAGSNGTFAPVKLTRNADTILSDDQPLPQGMSDFILHAIVL